MQNTLTPIWKMEKLKGIDNVTKDDLRLETGFVRVCENVNIDDEFMVERRDGVLRKIVSGNAHSGWSDGNRCYLVLDDDLVELFTNWTYLTLVSDVGPSRMRFERVGSIVFWSNLKYAGYIQESEAYPFPSSIRLNRATMAGGDLIEHHSGRLYVAQDGFIYRSLGGDPFEIDLEKDFMYLGGLITMMLGVNGPHGENGLYTSSAGHCQYITNLEPNLESAVWKTVLNEEAIPGSSVAIEEMDLGRGGGLMGRCAIWATKRGIYMGMPGGQVKDLTSKHYHLLDIVDGHSLIYDRGYRQYIFSGYAEPGYGVVNLGVTETVPIISMTGGTI